MKDHIRFTDTGTREPSGARIFRLTAYKSGREVAHVLARSGLAYAQTLRHHADPKAKPRSAEPIPEGVYSIGQPETDAGSWGKPGLAGHWMSIPPHPDYPLVGGRSAFGIHPDGAAPGSLGCTVTRTVADWRRVRYWREKLGLDTLIVDYGFGKVPKLDNPPVPAEYPTVPVMMDGAVVGKALIIDGTSYPSMALLAKLMCKQLSWDSDENTVILSE